MKAAIRSVVCSVRSRVRRHRLDGNPLRRRADRLETSGGVVAVLLVLVSLWPAVLAGRHSYETNAREASTSRQVEATLLEDAPTGGRLGWDGAAPEVSVKARWTTRTGEARTGLVPAPALTRAGATVPVWLDGGGAPASPPLSGTQIRIRAVTTSGLVVLVTALLCAGAFAALRWVLDRRRLAAWDAAWNLYNQHWQRRREV
ncbi:Rv1733c family protein [Nonomuraea cavernae]|uniref:Rv1733c family protein n=1 Tax=Nonomuraea cavernae TaxID=2045107 RepID=UPI0033EBD838